MRVRCGALALSLAACGSSGDSAPDDVGGPDWSFDFGDERAGFDSDAPDDTDGTDADAEGVTNCGTTPLPFEFVRDDGVDREDCLAASVCLSRESTGPIYNAAEEPEPHRFGCESVSPMGTEWAPGACRGNAGPFSTLRVAHECQSMVDLGGNAFCVHVLEEDLWFDLEFITFNGGAVGGGFSYRRTLAGGEPCGVGALCERTDLGVQCTCPRGTGGDPTSFCL